MACICTIGLGNMGTPGCAPISGVPKKFIFQSTYDDAGNKNFLDLSVTLDAAYLTTALNAASDVRLFPMPDLENVVSDRAESVFEEAPSGRKVFVKEGVRTLTGEIWGKEALPQLTGKIKNNRCADISAYMVDGDGNVSGTGDSKDPNKLYPIKLDSQSIDAILMFSTDSTKQKINIGVTWDESVKDEDLYMIQPVTDFTFDALEAKGLLDICVVYSNITTAGFTARLFNQYSLKTALGDSGLVVGDFSVYNNTAAAAEPITSATESPDGTYAIVYTTPVVSANELVLTPSKDGRDYTDVIATVIVTP